MHSCTCSQFPSQAEEVGFRPSIGVPDVWLPGNRQAPARHLRRGAALGPGAWALALSGACADRAAGPPGESGRAWSPSRVAGTRRHPAVAVPRSPGSVPPSRTAPRALGCAPEEASPGRPGAPTSQWDVGHTFRIFCGEGEAIIRDLAATRFPSSPTRSQRTHRPT